MSNAKSTEEESKKKRNLPSWMNSSDNESSSSRKKLNSSAKNEEIGQHKDYKTPSKEINANRKSKAHDSSLTGFSKLMDGVVFVLSGYVNPERSMLRSYALEMGAEYQPDWSSNCTLLVCAYSNTPKFRQVQADNGTIVKKDWILECYSQKKLVEIDSYLLHPGKPWRKNNNLIESINDQKPSSPKKSEEQVERGSHSKPTASSSAKARASKSAKENFSPSKVREWATDDLKRTISWLESQEEKPERSEIKQIAAGGIIICLQDAIDSLEQDLDVRKIAEQWNIIPNAVVELIKLLEPGKNATCLSKEDLCRHAKVFKQIYEEQLNYVNDDSGLKMVQPKNHDGESDANSADVAEYDSDKTVEMTEEEIELAYNNVAAYQICR